MTEFSLPYGSQDLLVQIPDHWNADYLIPEVTLPLTDPEMAIGMALSDPLRGQSLAQFDRSASIGIAINDKTRPTPNPNPLYPLLKHLEKIGFQRDKITLFIGSGTHTPMTRTELQRMLGDNIVSQYAIDVHDCDHSPMVDLGETAYKTPIQINAAFYHCDLKIVVGNIEPHHFMGFSGGVKTAAIGLASRETINKNHAMLSHPMALSGMFAQNPMRQDIEEIGAKTEIHFCLGTVLDEEKQFIKVLFGDPASVIKTAIPVIREVFALSVPHHYDLVIASPGGAPKDINLYQAQKGLTHAARIVRDGGYVILLAACPEGSGSPSYEATATSAASHQAIIEQFRNGFFRVGPHKAFQIARDAVRVNLVLVSEIPPETVKSWKLTPSTPALLNALIDELAEKLPHDARVAIMPASTRTMAEVNHATK